MELSRNIWSYIYSKEIKNITSDYTESYLEKRIWKIYQKIVYINKLKDCTRKKM